MSSTQAGEVGTQTRFMYLFERISEPIYFGPRGQGENRVLYVTPLDRLPPNISKSVAELRKGIPPDQVKSINVSYSSVPYDLTLVKVVPKDAIFSVFVESHMKAATALMKIFSEQTSLNDFFNSACLCRDEVNSHLWMYALARSMILRLDMKTFRLPAAWEIMPDRFLNGNVLREARRQLRLPETNRAIIVVDRSFTGLDLNPDNKVAYFREDVALNAAHWSWHIVYAFDAPPGQRDRKGELFFKMHHDLVNRYDAERLSNGLGRVIPLEIRTGALIEAYFSKLTLENSARNWGTRQDNTPLQNINHINDPNTRLNLDLADMEIWYQRLAEAIDQGIVITSAGQTIPLMNERGIDILGDMVETSSLTPNRPYYGNYHNMGHLALAAAADPDYRHKENLGVMASTETAVRDTSFFRWHKQVDNLFLRHKIKLTPYEPENFCMTGPIVIIAAFRVWPGVTVGSVTIQTEDRTPDTLVTFWEQRDVDLSRGLDFGRGTFNNLGPVLARFTHLQHEAFSYRLEVNNATGRPQVGTVRIFMAGSLDEHKLRLSFSEQWKMFFEMDKFTVSLKPGTNLFERKSVDSSLTIPWDQSFAQFERSANALTAQQTVCACGWPQHLLLPKGTTSGFQCDVVVMVTNWEQDRVRRKNPITDPEIPVCKQSVGFCGILNELYPDTKPMGFPFDRLPRSNTNGQAIDFLENWIPANSNMKGIQVKIFHRDVTFVVDGSATNLPIIVQGESTVRSYDVGKKASDIVGQTPLVRDSRSYQLIPRSGSGGPKSSNDWVDLGTRSNEEQVRRPPRETYSVPDSSFLEHKKYFDLY